MLWAALISGLTLGAAGSLHCVGMCGPLALALPTAHLTKGSQFISLLAYNAGRVVTYSILGMVFGLAGRRIYISGYQQWFSIAMGVLVLGLAALYYLRKTSIRIGLFDRFYFRLQQLIGQIIRKKRGVPGFFSLGLANGLLPCGLVYVAIAATLSFSEIGESVAFMAAFGAGTLPAMMLVGMAGKMIGPEARQSLRKAVPVFVTLMGIVLILRGLNLGIPYLSPALPVNPGDAVICHPE
ncbi:MAG: sulfite exporter TauE/SafE family protein [Chitinophagaceae bacterium]|nr:sulfite exporter TauE/SafE family protein [Chitinophagaceae bacterium]